MSLLLQTLWFQKIKAIADIVWAFACMLCVPALVMTTAFWAVGPSGGRSAYVTSRAETTVHASAGEMAQVPSGVKVSVDSDRKVYRMKLYNASNTLVYTYPDIVPEDGENPEIGNLMVNVPNGTPAGEYQLYVDVIYLLNPIKNNTLRVRVAKITVDKGQ